MSTIKLIGKKIFELRKKRGMTQIEVAKRIGINQRMLSNLERGFYKKIDPEILIKISDFFGVSVEYLIRTKEGEGEKESLKNIKQILEKLLNIIEEKEKEENSPSKLP